MTVYRRAALAMARAIHIAEATLADEEPARKVVRARTRRRAEIRALDVRKYMPSMSGQWEVLDRVAEGQYVAVAGGALYFLPK